MELKARNLKSTDILAVRQKIRDFQPLVHMIPNQVTAALCADGLSAVGARPFMAVDAGEMEQVLEQSAVSVINLGQPTAEKFRAAQVLLIAAAETGKTVVLDPVGCGASDYRLSLTQKLMEIPWKGVLKGNRGEISALQSRSLTMEGIDSIREHSVALSAENGRVLAVTGSSDLILSDTEQIVLNRTFQRKFNVVGSGCLLGALTGTCCAVEPDILLASASAFLLLSWAQKEANSADGYGSFKAAILDALSSRDDRSFAAYLETI